MARAEVEHEAAPARVGRELVQPAGAAGAEDREQPLGVEAAARELLQQRELVGRAASAAAGTACTACSACASAGTSAVGPSTSLGPSSSSADAAPAAVGRQAREGAGVKRAAAAARAARPDGARLDVRRVDEREPAAHEARHLRVACWLARRFFSTVVVGGGGVAQRQRERS